MVASAVDSSLRKLELKRAIRSGEQVRARRMESADVAAETYSALEEAVHLAEAERLAAESDLLSARDRASRRGWSPVDFSFMGRDATKAAGEAPPEYRAEYERWRQANSRLAPLVAQRGTAKAIMDGTKAAVVEADRQLAEWRTELARLEEQGAHHA